MIKEGARKIVFTSRNYSNYFLKPSVRFCKASVRKAGYGGKAVGRRVASGGRYVGGKIASSHNRVEGGGRSIVEKVEGFLEPIPYPIRAVVWAGVIVGGFSTFVFYGPPNAAGRGSVPINYGVEDVEQESGDVQSEDLRIKNP